LGLFTIIVITGYVIIKYQVIQVVVKCGCDSVVLT